MAVERVVDQLKQNHAGGKAERKRETVEQTARPYGGNC